MRGSGAAETTIDGDETHSRTTYDDDTITLDREGSQVYSSRQEEEGSFVFGNGATASTPLRPKHAGVNNSWESSVESPFDKNERMLRDMRIGGGDSYEESSDVPTPSLPTGYSLSGIARDSLGSTSKSKSSSAADDSLLSSPAARASSSTPKAGRVAHVTDLRNTPLNAKFPAHKAKASAHKSSSRPRSYYPPGFDFDDSDDEIVTGMSPPRTMNFGTLPPRAQAIQAAAREKTPKKDSDAQAILQDLLSDIDNYQPSPKMPTPENFKRYSLLPEEMGPGPAQQLFASAQQMPRKSMANTSFGSDIVTQPPQGAQLIGDDSFDQDDSFSSDGSGTVPPPADYRSDISYMTNTPGRPGVGDFSTTMQPGGDRGDMRDTEVFGPPSGGGVGRQGGAPFEIMKQDEMYTFHGGRLEDAAGEEVDRTPLRGLGKQR